MSLNVVGKVMAALEGCFFEPFNGEGRPDGSVALSLLRPTYAAPGSRISFPTPWIWLDIAPLARYR